MFSIIKDLFTRQKTAAMVISPTPIVTAAPVIPKKPVVIPIKPNDPPVVAVYHTVVTPPEVLTQHIPAINTMVSSPDISVINFSSVLSDTDVIKALAAIQVQLDRDFAPAWGLNATLKFRTRSTPMPFHGWLITLEDTSDEPGALGYHDRTSDGFPYAKIFAKDDLKYGLSWTVTLSHEIMEMMADPMIATCIFAQESNTTGTLYALEVCDPCEADSDGYLIDGILVSDFVYPEWFENFRLPNSAKFNFKGNIDRPLKLLPGGYISQFVINQNIKGWTQLTADKVPDKRQNYKGATSRFNRRKNLSSSETEVVLNRTSDKD